MYVNIKFFFDIIFEDYYKGNKWGSICILILVNYVIKNRMNIKYYG